MADAGSRAEAVSPPAGTGNAPGLGEAFALDLNTGQGGYSVALTLPEGIAGFTPAMRLEYHHGGGPGCFGMGWALPVRAIDLRLDYGAPGTATEVFTDGDRELVDAGGGEYRAIRESDFTRYRRVGQGWEVADRTGVTHRIGMDAGARIADPGHPERVITWLLQSSVDTSGNTASYAWDIDGGTACLASVSYAIYTVAFRYEERPDVIRSGRAGFGRTMSRRCTAIELHVNDGGTDRLVRRWALGYRQAAFSGASLLAQVQLTSFGPTGDGSDDVVRRPQQFSYREPDPSRWHAAFIAGAGGAYPPPMTDPRATLAPLGDGPVPGVLQVAGGRFTYWPGTGLGTFGEPRRLTEVPRVTTLHASGVQLLDLDGDAQVDLLVGAAAGHDLTGFYRGDGEGDVSEFVAYPRDRRGTPLSGSAALRVADLDGDGRVDVLTAAGRAYAWWRNGGSEGWDDPRLVPEGDGVNGPDVDLGDPLVRMADMTGDGLPDLVQIRSGAVVYWPNLGDGRFGAAVRMAGSPRTPAIATPPALLLADADGDGCADLVQADGTGVTVWPNLSGAGFGEPVRDPLVPAPIPGTVVPAVTTDDAAAGLAWCSQRSGATAYVRYDLGPSSYELTGVDNGAGLVSEIEYSTAAAEQRRDAGEGRRWARPLPFPLVVVAATRETDTITGQQAESRYRYHDAYYDDRTRTFQGFAEVEKTEVGDASRPDGRTVFFYRVGEDRLPGRGPEAAALNRMLQRVEMYADDASPQAGLPYTVEESEHDLSVLGTGPDGRQRVLVTVSSTTRRTIERTSDERAEQRTYTYDASGNVTREVHRCTGTLGGVAQPERVVITEVSYAVNAARNLLDRPARITRRDGTNALLMETQRYYDGLDFTGLPLGQADRGLLSRETRWALTRADFDAHYAGMDPASLGYQDGTDADGRAGVFAPAERNRHDAQGRKTGRQSPTGAVSTIGYDPSGLFRATETNPLGTTTSVFDLATGKATEITGADGAVVLMRYDAQGRLAAVALPGDDLALPTRSYSYDDSRLPNVVRVAMRLQSGAPETALTAVYFDGRMREIQRRVEMSPGQFVVSGHAVRNPWGDSAAEYEPTFDASADYAVPGLAGRPSRQFGYDVLGRPVRTADYGGGVSTATYAPFSVETADPNDNDASAANVARGQFGTVRVDHVDAAQHRVATDEQGGSGPVVTTFEPDVLGRLVAHGDGAGEVERSTFDGLGNRLRIAHREAGERRCFYDAQSRMVRTVDGAGHDIAASFDAVDRITGLTAGGVARETYRYDDLATNGFGRLREVTYPGGSQRFGYDRQGRMTSHAFTFDGIGQDNVFGYGYDAQGRRTSVTYPDGSVVTHELYANGVPRRVPGFVDLIEYDPRMLLSGISYANGVASTVTYTPGVGRVAHQRTTGPGGAVLDDQTLGYDAMSRLLSVTHAEPGNSATTTYDYDPLYQLRRVTDDPGGGGAAVTTAYSYARGRLLAGNGESGLTLHYDDAAHPGRVSHISDGAADLPVSYDGNGNMTSLPGRVLAFGPKNQLETVTRDDGTVVTYVYDHTGQRVRKQVRRGADVTDTLLLGTLAEVRDGQLASYVVLGSSRVALVYMGATNWIHTDQLGSVTFYTDAAGILISSIAYRAFGNARTGRGSPWAQVFALHEFDSDAGLYYMRRRWYAPDLGCFVSPDGVYLLRPERGADSPATLWLYGYAANDPANNVDPDGGSFWSVVGGIVGVIVGVIVAVVVIAAFASGIGFGLLALAGLILAVTGGYLLASANQGSAFGEFMKGFLIGFNAGLNATFMTAIGGPWLGLAVGVIGFLAVFDSVRQNSFYQGVLGWSNWLMPMSWLVLGIGLIFFVLNILGAVFTLNQVGALKITYIHMDWSTGSIVMKGGWISNLNPIDTAFDMGNFVYVDRANSSPDDDVAHETGHNLSLAAFGSIVHLVGFVDEFASGGAGAWTERMADSHAHKGTDHTWG